jgi:hypothetical protein
LGTGWTAIVLSIVFYVAYNADIQTKQLSDDEIMEQAAHLGMIQAADITPASSWTDVEVVEKARELGMIFASEAPAPSETSTPPPTGLYARDDADYFHVYIPPGTSSADVSVFLQNLGIVWDADYFNGYLMEIGVDQQVRPGDHDIPKGVAAEQLIAILTR